MGTEKWHPGKGGGGGKTFVGEGGDEKVRVMNRFEGRCLTQKNGRRVAQGEGGGGVRSSAGA